MTAVRSAPKDPAATLVGRSRLAAAWRRSADEARGDRLATAAVGFICAVTGAAVALFMRGTPAAVCVGLVTLCVTPGCALACWLSTKDRLTRVVTVLAASLTWTVLVTAVLAWERVTTLGVFLIATAGVGGIGSAVFLAIQLARYLKRMPVAASVDEGDSPIRRKAVGSSPNPEFVAPSHRSPALNLLLISALVAATGLWALAVAQARGHTVGSYGLLPVLGSSFLVAAVLTIGVLAVALRFIRTAWPAAVVALGLLLFEFSASPIMLASTPLGTYTYKHFGVVDYIVHGGALRDSLDIYQQWPGFFAAAAGLVRLSGRGPLAYANWAELLFEALNAVVIFAIARRFSRGHPVVPYVTVLLFETANWEGQIYYSPQTMAFLLALIFQFFLLSLLEPARLRRPLSHRRWLTIPPLESQGGEQNDNLGMAARVVGIIAIFGAIVITHQLTPYVVFSGIACLWALGVLRHWPVVLTLAMMLVIYTLLHLPAVDHNQLLTGFSFGKSAGGPPPLASSSPQQALAGVLAKAIGLGIWGATGVCVLSYWRRLGVIVIPVILAFTPLLFLLITDYDGEVIYRVFLFSSPWCALIIAMRLATLVRMPILRWTAVGFWALFAALGSAQASAFGMYPMSLVPPGEISASAYFLEHAPPKAVLVLAAASFPSRLNGLYTLHNLDTQNDPSLDEVPQFDGNGLDRIDPKAVAQVVAYLAGGTGYLVIAPSMDQYVNYDGTFKRGILSALVPRLKASPYWRVWYSKNGVIIFQALPKGRL